VRGLEALLFIGLLKKASLKRSNPVAGKRVNESKEWA
jgi:hypothetical protein